MSEAEVERTHWYELLCRLASMKGLRVLLHTTSVGAGPFGSGRQSKPAMLEVRRSGQTIAHAFVGDHEPALALDDAADAVLTQLELAGEPFDRKAA